MARPRRPPSQTWRTFLANHLGQIAAADFLVVPTATCRLLFVLVILADERRRVVHVAITDHPTTAWTAQQLREAFPWNGTAPISSGIGTPPFTRGPRRRRRWRFTKSSPRRAHRGRTRTPRLIGSIRRECLDHIIV